MRLKEIKVNLWHKYILYYCIIFIIPFVLLGFITLNSSLSRVEEQFDNNIISNLNQSEKILSSQIEELQNIAISISKDSYLLPNMMEHNYYSSIGKEMISRYVSSKSIIDDIVIYYFSNNNKYYSSKGSYNDIDVLISEYYKDINISKQTLKNIFNINNSHIISLPINNKDNSRCELYYVFPLYDFDGMQYGTATFLLNEEALKSTLPAIDSNNKNEAYITNNSNYVLLSNNENLTNKFIDSKGKIVRTVAENTTYNIGENKYRIIISNSNELGLKFINIVNNKDLAISLISTKMIILKLLAVLFLIGLGLILLISYYQYAPIRKINDNLNKKTKYNLNQKNKNELESIEVLVANIINQNEELIVKNKYLYNIDKNQVLLDLIEGTNTENDKEKHQFISHLKLSGKNYYIILFKKSQLCKESKFKIKDILNKEYKHYSTFSIQIPLQDKFAVLVVHKDLDMLIEDSLKDIEYKVSEIDKEAYFYCGSLYDELHKINQSYIEAMIACDYIVDTIENKYVLYRENYNYDESIIKYPYDLEEKLVYAIKQGSKDVVEDSLRQILDFIDINKYYSEQMKVYSLYLASLIIKSASQVDFPHQEINMKELVEYNNRKKFEENILNLARDINKFVSSKRKKVKDKFIENIFNDIHESYKSHDLSLELLSQKYDYSVPYLSKMIKEETGMTFTKYIQELRFNYIKESLVKTDIPIKEIVFGAGYYDMSNFSRKFKTIMGVTPGQYREINKPSKSLDVI